MDIRHIETFVGRFSKTIILFLGIGYLMTSVSIAQLRLPRLISNGMVLQRDTPLNIWGWASPGENVSLNFRGKSFSGIADQQGKWSIQLPAQKSGGPFDMKISASNSIVINDILVGEVWLCSGQSNMEQSMSGRLKYRYADEIAHDSFPQIRQFLVPDVYDFKKEREDFSVGSWRPAGHGSIEEFTAVGYFFAKSLYQKYQVPIGILNASLGGSPAEAWMSENALKEFPNSWKEMQKFKDSVWVSDLEKRDQAATNQWYSNLLSEDAGQKFNWRYMEPGDDWDSIQVPGYWNKVLDGKIPGVIWCKKIIIVPATMVSGPTKLELGRIVDSDSVFVNGQFIGATSYQYPARRHEIAGNTFKPGANIITMRIVCNSNSGGFVPDRAYQLTNKSDTIDLSGTWRYKTGNTMPGNAQATTTIRWKPGGLYNAMISPLTHYSIRGVVWYQGESNASEFQHYAALMRGLILDWRDRWKNESMPFLYVQLPNFQEPSDTVQILSQWAGIRQQQIDLLKVSNTAMAVTIDLGEWNDIHPEHKKEVGDRLSLLAMQKVYSEKIISSAPIIQTAKKRDNKIVLKFSSADLLIKPGEKLHLYVGDEDGHFFRTPTEIKKDQLILNWSQTSKPLRVYYAWADNPSGVLLYSKFGLPVSPFFIVVQ